MKSSGNQQQEKQYQLLQFRPRTAAQVKRIRAEAKSEGLSVSAFIRKCVDLALPAIAAETEEAKAKALGLTSRAISS